MIPVFTMIGASLFGALAHGHGEDKPGPHGGFIRMPGAFHTELVQDSANKLKVYLLDINWQNPSIKEGSVEVRYGKKGETAKCRVTEGIFYLCTFSKKIDLSKKGSLEVLAKRENIQGNLVTYPLPLRLETMDDGHGNHR